MTDALWPLVLYFLLAAALIAALIALSYYLGERHHARAADEPFESGIVTVGYARLRLSAKYYLVAMFFVIFDVEAVFLYAWAVSARDLGWTGYVEALVFIGILLAALAYLWRLGALDFGPDRRKHRVRSAQRDRHALASH